MHPESCYPLGSEGTEPKVDGGWRLGVRSVQSSVLLLLLSFPDQRPNSIGQHALPLMRWKPERYNNHSNLPTTRCEPCPGSPIRLLHFCEHGMNSGYPCPHQRFRHMRPPKLDWACDREVEGSSSLHEIQRVTLPGAIRVKSSSASTPMCAVKFARGPIFRRRRSRLL